MKPRSRRAGIARHTAVAGILACATLYPYAGARAVDVTGNAAVTTDYVWRGTTQTRGKAAFQAGFAVSGKSGFYLSLWGSNVDFGPGTDAHDEFDTAVGWSGMLHDDWTLDTSILHYAYPGARADLDWTELDATATWRGRYWVLLGWSNRALGYDAAGLYTQVGARFPVRGGFRFEASLGHYFLDDTVLPGQGYSDAAVSAVWAFQAPFEIRLTEHATSAGARGIFGKNLAGSRLELALQASWP